MKKWNEINAETLKDILQQFIRYVDWTQNKVIEVQCPMNILEGKPMNRFYFCNNMNWNKYLSDDRLLEPYLEAIKTMATSEQKKSPGIDMSGLVNNILRPGNVMYYIELTNDNPLIMPILCEGAASTMLLNTPFADDLVPISKGPAIIEEDKNVKWYIKDKAKKIIDDSLLSYTKYNPTDKLYRIRSIEYTEWETMMSTFLDTGKLSGCEEDFHALEFKKK